MSKLRKNGVWVDKSLAKKRVNGAWVDADKDYYVRTPNISGVPPFTFKSDGENLRDWSITGQTVQASTPTPSSPVAVEGVGERTGNLFDPETATLGKYIDNNGNEQNSSTQIPTQRLNHSDFFEVSPSLEYTFASVKASTVQQTVAFVWYTSAKTFISRTTSQKPTGTTEYSLTATAPSNAAYAIINYTTANNQVMLNTGSTAQPFEPYGVKIPVNVQSGNLWNGVFPEPSENVNKYIPIYVGDGDFTFSTNAGLFNSQYAVYMFMAGRVTSGGSSANNGVSVGHPRTVTAINGYVTIVYHGYSGGYYPENFWGMLNRGSTPLSYQPYSNTTTNIYLGSASTTRRVKKLVLTGSEDWASFEQSGTTLYRCANSLTGKLAESPVDTMICNCLQAVSSRGGCASTSNSISVYNVQSDSRPVVNVNPMTLSEWTTFIQQQYAAGTPVTIWYVLATPETAAVNEPLMKIGTYADELTKTGAGVNIPTVSGSNTLTVNTTVQPSGMTIQSISQWV